MRHAIETFMAATVAAFLLLASAAGAETRARALGMREAGVESIEELAAKVPAFKDSDTVIAEWIPAKPF